ncbi:MAG: twin-arginine translocation signal domain-containing protein, partial [Candidatus Nanopelagicales bacterium]
MAGGTRVDRRTFLQGAASALAMSGIGVVATASPAMASRGDRRPIRMAMHIHACFSEGDASMEAHLQQAKLNDIDVIWWTEHDHRMVARRYLKDVHFNGLSEYANDSGIVWRSHYEGSIASSSATIVTSPVSINDAGGRALRLATSSRPSSTGTRRLVADVKDYGLNTSLDGTTITMDVRPQFTGPDSWVDVRMRTSYRPAR